MKICIDISQIVYQGGVSNFAKKLVKEMILGNSQNEYILFGSSLRKKRELTAFTSQFNQNKNVSIKLIPLPISVLEFLWNTLHIISIELFTGNTDVFLSSDWVQPPTKAKKATILYDLIVYRYPEEMAKQIVAVQKRRMKWVKKEVDAIICISESTKKDAMKILNIPEEKLSVIYPGL